MVISELGQRRWRAHAAAWGTACSSVVIVGWLLAFSCHGLDFTDEGYYLTWISDPAQYTASASQFGFLYHPIYLALGENISLLRQANVLLTAALATVMFVALAQSAWAELRIRETLGPSIALSTVSLASFGSWLITPSYNSLALQGFMLAATGIAVGVRPASSGLFASLIIGTGGAIAFLAKPVAAAALTLLAAPMLLVAGRERWVRIVLLASASAALYLIAFAFLVDGNIMTFGRRLTDGAEMMSLLGSTYSASGIFRWDSPQLIPAEEVLLVSTAVVCATLAWTAKTEALQQTSAWASFAFSLGAVCMLSFGFTLSPLTAFQNVPSVGLALGAAAAALAGGAWRTDLRTWAFAGAMISLPAAYAFGSNNHYWVIGGNASVFWIAGGAWLLAKSAPNGVAAMRAWLPIGAVSQALVVTVLVNAHDHPYRQSYPASEQRTLTAIRDSHVFVSSETATYLERLRILAKESGLRAGTPMIDLTGQSPTTLFALHAKAIGSAWWAGGYPGSYALAAWLIDRLSCQELAMAWVVLEPEGPRSIPGSVLKNFGAHQNTDYELAFVLTTPSGSGGFQTPRDQHFLRPLRQISLAQRACETARELQRTQARS